MNPFANGVIKYAGVDNTALTYMAPLLGLASGAMSYKNPKMGIPVGLGAASGLFLSEMMSKKKEDEKKQGFVPNHARGFASGVLPGVLLAHFLSEKN